MYTDKNGNNWYKGNLHSHTKISDGRYEPEDTLKLYHDHGYDFIALTDHYKYGSGGVDAETGILVIPGVEYDTGSHPSENIYHIICVCADTEPQIDRGNGKPDVQTIVDAVKNAGGVAILAHPAWSFNDPAYVEQIKGIDATEIYNTVSGKPWNIRPYSGLFVDRMAADGFDLGIVAADDVHFYNGDQCRSYVLVNAKENNRESLRSALLSGNYIATQGPFLTLEKTDEGIRAEVCPTEDNARIVDITFFTDAAYATGRVFTAAEGETLTEAVYKFNSRERFVRAEATDEFGRMAWSGIVRL